MNELHRTYISIADVKDRLATIKNSGLSEYNRGIKSAQVCKSAIAYAMLKEDRELLDFVLDTFDVLGMKSLKAIAKYGGYNDIAACLTLFKASKP